MAIEIERKFLLKNDPRKYAVKHELIEQGYLTSGPGVSVRIRIAGDDAFITVKGSSEDDGLSRYEFEKAIPLADGQDLMKLCTSGIIRKTRYFIPVGNHMWEVDVFAGDNAGLFVAEVELKSVHDEPEIPSWVGEEVTGDVKYYNSYIAKHPYSSW